MRLLTLFLSIFLIKTACATPGLVASCDNPTSLGVRGSTHLILAETSVDFEKVYELGIKLNSALDEVFPPDHFFVQPFALYVAADNFEPLEALVEPLEAQYLPELEKGIDQIRKRKFEDAQVTVVPIKSVSAEIKVNTFSPAFNFQSPAYRENFTSLLRYCSSKRDWRADTVENSAPEPLYQRLKNLLNATDLAALEAAAPKAQHLFVHWEAKGRDATGTERTLPAPDIQFRDCRRLRCF